MLFMIVANSYMIVPAKSIRCIQDAFKIIESSVHIEKITRLDAEMPQSPNEHLQLSA